MQIWVENVDHFCCHTILGVAKKNIELGSLLLYSIEKNLHTVNAKENIEH